ncbi:MAG: hypothetical protein ACREUQ_04105, partial [Burkholderiales bacterium]
HGTDSSKSGDVLTFCDNCGHCHLATACTLPSSAPITAVFVKQARPSTVRAALSSIVLPSPRRPPLLTLS